MSAEGKLEFYCGSLGSGKTSFAFERGLEHLLRGGTVVTNIEFYPDKVAQWMHEEHGLEFDRKRLVKMEDGPDFWKQAIIGSADLEAMLIVDEAHVEHNARAWDKSSMQETLFNTMARKLRIHLIYITQDINNVDKQFRRMAQVIWYCRNLKQYKLLGGLVSFPFNLFFRVPYLCGPGVPPRPMQPEITMRPTSWGMFDSHNLVGRAAETFSILKAAESSPLRRLPRPPKPFRWHLWLPVAASLYVVLT